MNNDTNIAVLREALKEARKAMHESYYFSSPISIDDLDAADIALNVTHKFATERAATVAKDSMVRNVIIDKKEYEIRFLPENDVEIRFVAWRDRQAPTSDWPHEVQPDGTTTPVDPVDIGTAPTTEASAEPAARPAAEKAGGLSERHAFEAWYEQAHFAPHKASAEHFELRPLSLIYKMDHIQRSWEAWQARATFRTTAADAGGLSDHVNGVIEMPQHIPGNFTTHRAAWRDAITECINREMANSDRAAYWEHELAAYDRAFARLLDNPEPLRPTAVMAGGLPYAEYSDVGGTSAITVCGVRIDAWTLSRGPDTCRETARRINAASAALPPEDFKPLTLHEKQEIQRKLINAGTYDYVNYGAEIERVTLQRAGFHRPAAMGSVDLPPKPYVWKYREQFTFDEMQEYARTALAARPTASGAVGRCTLQEHCRCGGDVPRVREGCANWMKGGAA